MEPSTCPADVIHRIVRTAEAHGVSPDRALREAQLERGALRDGAARIGVRHLHGLWRFVGRARPSICAEMARSMRLDELGPFGFLIQTAPDLDRALRASTAFYGMINSDGSWQLEASDETILVRWVRSSRDTEGAARCDEAVVASFVCGLRQVAHDPRVVRGVCFRLDLGDRRALEATVGCRIDDGAGFTGFSLSSRALSAPPPHAHEAMHRYFEDLVRSRHREVKRSASGLVEWVRAEVERSLQDGCAQGPRVARALGVDERTLRRRLEAEGTSLRAIVDEARRDEALRLLEESGRSLSAIAFAVGFSDASAFSRAGRRWWGASPERVRARLRSN